MGAPKEASGDGLPGGIAEGVTNLHGTDCRHLGMAAGTRIGTDSRPVASGGTLPGALCTFRSGCRGREVHSPQTDLRPPSPPKAAYHLFHSHERGEALSLGKEMAGL